MAVKLLEEYIGLDIKGIKWRHLKRYQPRLQTGARGSHSTSGTAGEIRRFERGIRSHTSIRLPTLRAAP